MQAMATCGLLHAVNHALHTLPGFATPLWQPSTDGDWGHSALQRNVKAAGARMHPVQVEAHEDLAAWLGDAPEPHMSLWRPGNLGCVMHTPGHWVALTPPDEVHTEARAAFLCDSLFPQPYALSVEELGLPATAMIYRNAHPHHAQTFCFLDMFASLHMKL